MEGGTNCMIKTCWFDANGQLINIGDWDYQVRQIEVESAEYDEKGNMIKEPVYENRPTNPLPDGAYSEGREVVQDSDGGWRLADVPQPETPEQRISTLEDENAFLALELATAQSRLDQTEQEQAELLLLLVSQGVI
jgi:hypothetical protein